MRLNGIEITIDAGALTGNGGNGNGGDDDNNNGDGVVRIEASLCSHGMDAGSVFQQTQTQRALHQQRRRKNRVR